MQDRESVITRHPRAERYENEGKSWSGKTLRKIACYDYDIGCRCIYAIRQPSRSTKDARWIIKFLVPAAGRALWLFILILQESQRELV